ncbi:PREDICTED: uncharacterized protein LOC109395258 isoform X2 [Hipposideros armiger]|uniref:Uncharacterized protein LOC109395258 isoform X2 n=1 Tax=Hipposideros armiger TaxID=186990 RepID=A0A8B7TAG0_HIPAR|nr:PREDICTED: uncharacterized protein LOC109395258 isoform X2 [Hipposideros armiger]
MQLVHGNILPYSRDQPEDWLPAFCVLSTRTGGPSDVITGGLLRGARRIKGEDKKMEAEVGVTRFEGAGRYQKPHHAGGFRKLENARDRLSRGAPREERSPADTLILNFWPPELGAEMEVPSSGPLMALPKPSPHSKAAPLLSWPGFSSLPDERRGLSSQVVGRPAGWRRQAQTHTQVCLPFIYWCSHPRTQKQVGSVVPST